MLRLHDASTILSATAEGGQLLKALGRGKGSE